MTLMQMLMKTADRLAPLRAPDGAGGGAGTPPAGATPAAPPAGAPATGGDAPPPGGQPPAGGDGAPPKPWYEARQWSDPALREALIANGYHNGTAEEALERALKGERAAVSRLGKPPGQLLDAPKEGQSLTDWMKANAKVFGLPESVDKYELKLPEGLPAAMPMDEALLSDYRAWAAENGVPPAIAQANVEAFGGMMAKRFTAIEAEAAKAEAKLVENLQAEWGPAWKDKQAQAVRAFHALAAEMKLAPEQANVLAQKLNADMGDATLLKFFATLAVKMGEDTLAAPRGTNAPALQLAEAQSRKAKIMERDTGEMAAAVRKGDQRRVGELRNELEGLNTIIAQHGGA